MRRLFTACMVLFLAAALGHAQNRPAESPPEKLEKEVAQLLELMTSDKYRERESAHTKLEELLNDRQGAVLGRLQETCRKTTDPEVKMRLERILKPYARWQITPAVLNAQPNITELLEKNTRGSMRTAIEALRRLDIKDTRGVLFAILQRGGEDDFPGKRRAIEALVEQADSQVVEFFVGQLKQRGEEEGCDLNLEHILARTGEKCVGPVARALHTADSYQTRCSAAAVLGAVGEKGRIALEQALKTGGPAVKRAALRGFLYNPGIKLPTDMLFDLAKSSEEKVRGGAVRLLVRTKHEKAIETLSVVLAGDKSYYVRLGAVLALGEAGGSNVVEPLLKAINDTDENVQEYARKALLRTGDKRIIKALPLLGYLCGPMELVVEPALMKLGDEAVEELTGMLKTVGPYRRKLVVRALRFTGSRLALPVFLKVLADKKKDIWARVEAVDALAVFNEKKVVAALIEALKDSHSSIRASSACSLGLLKDRQAVEPLVKTLQDKDALVRACAAQALCWIGDRRAVKHLAGMLEDINSRVRFYAIRALAEIGDESAFEPFVKSLENRKTNCGDIPKALAITGGEKAIPHLVKLFNSIFDKEASREILRFGQAAVKPLLAAVKSDSTQTKIHALYALAELRDEKAFDIMLEALKDESWEVREAAAEAIAFYKDARAIESLVKLLRDDVADVRAQAASSLGRLGDRRAVKPLIDILLNDIIEGPRSAAADALGRIGDKAAIEPLIAVMLDDEVEGYSPTLGDFRGAAAGALASFKDDRVVNALIKRLEDEDDDIASAAMQALGEIGDRRAALPLMKMESGDGTVAVLRKLRAPESAGFFFSILERNAKLLMSPSWGQQRRGSFVISFDDTLDYRITPIYALGEIGNKRALEPLRKLLKSGSPEVQTAAAAALLHLGDEQAGEVLKNALCAKNPEKQRAAVDAVLESPNPKAVPWLIEALRSNNFIVRNNACVALGKLGDKSASDALTALIEDENPLVRQAAAGALGKIDKQRAVKHLVRLLSSDPDLGVRETALEALQEITGEDFGWNHQRWQEWLKKQNQ